MAESEGAAPLDRGDRLVDCAGKGPGTCATRSRAWPTGEGNRIGVSDDTNSVALPPQHKPPVHLKDPLVRRLRVARAAWAKAMRGRVPKPADVAVARCLADYGNKDGSNCHPGVERLATDTCLSTATVKRSLAWLAEHGWVTRERRAARKLGKADVWAVSIPATVAAELGMWDEQAQGPLWMERPVGEPKRPGMLDRPPPSKPGPKPHPKTVTPPGFYSSETPLLELNNSDVGIRNSVLGLTGEPPPVLSHQVFSHHAASVSRPHAPARGSQTSSDDDIAEWVLVQAEEKLGHELGDQALNLVESMLERGAHPVAIVNAAVAFERDYAEGA